MVKTVTGIGVKRSLKTITKKPLTSKSQVVEKRLQAQYLGQAINIKGSGHIDTTGREYKVLFTVGDSTQVKQATAVFCSGYIQGSISVIDI